MRLTAPASRALLGVLRGEAAPEPPSDTLRARARDGDEQAIDALRAYQQAMAGARLAELAVRYEAVQVAFDDGTVLSLDDGERALASKEERRPHRALRAALDRALDPIRQLYCYGNERARDAAASAAFLAETDDLGRAALEALEVLGGSDVDDDAALARALDLPCPELQRPQALALNGVARAAAAVSVRTVRMPRALTGVVLLGDGVRLGVFDGLGRAHRFFRMVRGGYQALACAVSAAPVFGAAMALGALLPPALRGGGLARGDAERCARLGVAREVLAARVGVARALFGWPEALERAIPRPLRPTLALRELLDEHWEGSVGSDSDVLVGAAAVAVALRDAHDEAFAISAAAWRDPVSSTADNPAAAWRRWATPWL